MLENNWEERNYPEREVLRITYQRDEWNVNDNTLMYEILWGWGTLERMTEV